MREKRRKYVEHWWATGLWARVFLFLFGLVLFRLIIVIFIIGVLIIVVIIVIVTILVSILIDVMEMAMPRVPVPCLAARDCYRRKPTSAR